MVEESDGAEDSGDESIESKSEHQRKTGNDQIHRRLNANYHLQILELVTTLRYKLCGRRRGRGWKLWKQNVLHLDQWNTHLPHYVLNSNYQNIFLTQYYFLNKKNQINIKCKIIKSNTRKKRKGSEIKWIKFG